MMPQSMVTGNDCYRACIATILAIPIEQLPPPPESITEENWPDYNRQLEQVVRELGFEMICMGSESGKWAPRGLAIASYPCPIVDHWDRALDELGLLIPHAVVADDGKVVFDPCPRYRGASVTYQGPPIEWVIFQARAPARLLSATVRPISRRYADGAAV